MASVSLLIPAYNEEGTIGPLLEHALTVLKRCCTDFELVTLDDCSRDNTHKIMLEVAAKHPQVRVYRHEVNRGIAATFEELYTLAQKELVFLISGDGQFPPELLERCLPLIENYDIVICRRVQKHYTLYRSIISACYRWLPRMLFGIDLKDSGTVKLVRKKVYEEIPVHSTSVFVEAERIIRAHARGYRITSIDIVPSTRTKGIARGGRLSTVVKAGLDMLRVFWELRILRRPA